MPIYDYICESGHKTEALRGLGVETIPCPLCGQHAHRSTVYHTHHVMAKTGERMRDTYRRFQEASGEIDYTCNKFESETNATVPGLGLWQQAKKEAKKHEL